MTTEDLIPLLEQAGISQEVWFEHHRSIERFAALVEQRLHLQHAQALYKQGMKNLARLNYEINQAKRDEQERCVRLCEAAALLPDAGPLYCAESIRARGNE